MLLVASGFGQVKYLSIPNDGPSLTEANRLVKTTTHKNGQIEMVVQSSISAIGGDDHSGYNLTKTSVQMVNDSSSSASFDTGDKGFRTRRSLPNVNMNMSSNQKDQERSAKYDHNRDVVSAIYTLVILSIIYLFEAGFNR